MGYNSPSEMRDYQKTYSQVRKCPQCGSTNIQKGQGKDSLGDLIVIAKCNSCGFDAELQVGLGHGWG